MSMNVTYYNKKTKQNIKLDCFQPIKTYNLKKEVIRLEGTDCISKLSGYYSNSHIEYLEILTKRGLKYKIGSDLNY